MVSNYHRNNILFRIASSTALSKFKGAQAHAFIQLARKELKFDDSAKEVVLLEYDRFSQWLFRIEKLCFCAEATTVTRHLLQTIKNLFDEEVQLVEGVLEGNGTIFSQQVVDFTRLIHRHLYPVILGHLNKVQGEKVGAAYSSIVETTTSFLEYLLIALHEFNSNIIQKSEHPFLGFSGFYLNEDHRFEGLAKRAEFFVKAGVSPHFTLKNYAAENVFHDAAAYLQKLDVELVPEEGAEIAEIAEPTIVCS